MANALEQSFALICAKHDVETLGVNFTSKPGMEPWFTVYAHGGGHLGSFTAPTLSKALGAAIAELTSKRGLSEPISLADEPLSVAA